MTEALGQVTSAEGQRTGARSRLAGTQETLDGATAELDARARRLLHAAADRGLPASAGVVDWTTGQGADPEQVILTVLPEAAATVLDAFTAATRAGGSHRRGVEGHRGTDVDHVSGLRDLAQVG